MSDSLDLLFMNLTPGDVIPLFSIGISIGSAKTMSALNILFVACYGCSGVGEMPDAEYVAIGHHLMALMSIKATCARE